MLDWTVILNLFLIQIIVCFIIDLSGIIDSLEEGMSRILGYKMKIPKPFSCSLCSTWWTGIIYLLAIGGFTLPHMTALALISFLTKSTSGFILWIQEFIIYLEGILFRWIR